MRGEYIFKNPGHSPIIGSSPRAWGIHARPISGSLAARFIPTCVGNTNPLGAVAQRDPVHPHVRGEYIIPPFGSRIADGSSPRAWGILYPRHVIRDPIRFIPTCVGNTVSFSLEFGSRIADGSSPRAWGIQGQYVLSSGADRFIPTCVGNTLSWLVYLPL